MKYIKKIFIQTSLLVAMLTLPVWSVGVVANNFVDDINVKAYSTGHQVVYEMNIGMFTSAGTFNAAQNRLAELKLDGVDVIWLMPIYPRGGGIDSPYAATDFQAVNPAYGTIADLKSFVTEAHKLGMKVWLDWVPNHTATNAKWVTTHPEYYKKQNERFVHPNNYGDVYQLDYSNPDLVNAMNSCLKFWIQQANIDGYRCDYISSNEIPASYWSDIIPQLKNLSSNKEFTMLGESDLTDTNNARLQKCGFDYDYAWGFHTKLEEYGPNGVLANPLKIHAQNLITKSKQMDVGRMLYITNHDQNYNYDRKTLTQKYGDNKYLLTVLTYTLWGMPLLYNGQEIGGEQVLDYFKDTKIDWLNVDHKMRNTVRTLAALKHSQKALGDSKTWSENPEVRFLTTINNNSSILAYSRQAGESEVVVILNTATIPQTALFNNIQGTYSQWLHSDSIARGYCRHLSKFNGNLSVVVPAKGYIIYVKGNYSDENLPQEQPLTDLVATDEYAIYYESPIDNATVCAWMWSDTYGGEKYATTGTWPGDKFSRLGIIATGNVVYKYAFQLGTGMPLPQHIIITENGSDDSHKVINSAAFVNHGYYVKGETNVSKTVPTGILSIGQDHKQYTDKRCYNLQGQIVDATYSGIIICQGKKYLKKSF